MNANSKRGIQALAGLYCIGFLVQAAMAQTVQAGTDLWASASPVTFNIGGIGPVDFCGAPPVDPTVWGLPPGTDTGNADTVVERLSGADLSGGPATIPIEIVALSLTSCAPITVDFGGGPNLWDVRVGLSQLGPSQGAMVIQGGPSGGTFDSTFFVRPVFTFTEVGNPLVNHVIDGQQLVFWANNVPWSPVPPPGALLIPGPFGDPRVNFHVGAPPGMMDFFFPTPIPFGGNGGHWMVSNAVPEPAACVVLVTGLMGLLRKRRR